MQLGQKPNMHVQEFLESDRQWTRNCRILHARANIRAATTRDAKQFWREVLDALTD